MNKCDECMLAGSLYCPGNLEPGQCIKKLQSFIASGDFVSKNYILLELLDLLDEYSELDENGLHDAKWCGIKEAYGIVENAPNAAYQGGNQ